MPEIEDTYLCLAFCFSQILTNIKPPPMQATLNMPKTTMRAISQFLEYLPPSEVDVVVGVVVVVLVPVVVAMLVVVAAIEITVLVVMVVAIVGSILIIRELNCELL